MAHSFIIETRKKEKKVVAWKRVARPNYREREPGHTVGGRRTQTAEIDQLAY